MDEDVNRFEQSINEMFLRSPIARAYAEKIHRSYAVPVAQSNIIHERIKLGKSAISHGRISPSHDEGNIDKTSRRDNVISLSSAGGCENKTQNISNKRSKTCLDQMKRIQQRQVLQETNDNHVRSRGKGIVNTKRTTRNMNGSSQHPYKQKACDETESHAENEGVVRKRGRPRKTYVQMGSSHTEDEDVHVVRKKGRPRTSGHETESHTEDEGVHVVRKRGRPPKSNVQMKSSHHSGGLPTSRRQVQSTHEEHRTAEHGIESEDDRIHRTAEHGIERVDDRTHSTAEHGIERVDDRIHSTAEHGTRSTEDNEVQRLKEKDADKPIKEFELNDWIIRKVANGVIVDGLLKNQGRKTYWHSSRVKTRISNRKVTSSTGSVYILSGLMNTQECLSCGELTPQQVQAFKRGFPKNWKSVINGPGTSVVRMEDLPRTRSGRVVIPPLAYWAKQRVCLHPRLNVTTVEMASSSDTLISNQSVIVKCNKKIRRIVEKDNLEKWKILRRKSSRSQYDVDDDLSPEESSNDELGSSSDESIRSKGSTEPEKTSIKQKKTTKVNQKTGNESAKLLEREKLPRLENQELSQDVSRQSTRNPSEMQSNQARKSHQKKTASSREKTASSQEKTASSREKTASSWEKTASSQEKTASSRDKFTNPTASPSYYSPSKGYIPETMALCLTPAERRYSAKLSEVLSSIDSSSEHDKTITGENDNTSRGEGLMASQIDSRPEGSRYNDVDCLHPSPVSLGNQRSNYWSNEPVNYGRISDMRHKTEVYGAKEDIYGLSDSDEEIEFYPMKKKQRSKKTSNKIFSGRMRKAIVTDSDTAKNYDTRDRLRKTPLIHSESEEEVELHPKSKKQSSKKTSNKRSSGRMRKENTRDSDTAENYDVRDRVRKTPFSQSDSEEEVELHPKSKKQSSKKTSNKRSSGRMRKENTTNSDTAENYDVRDRVRKTPFSLSESEEEVELHPKSKKQSSKKTSNKRSSGRMRKENTTDPDTAENYDVRERLRKTPLSHSDSEEEIKLHPKSKTEVKQRTKPSSVKAVVPDEQSNPKPVKRRGRKPKADSAINKAVESSDDVLLPVKKHNSKKIPPPVTSVDDITAGKGTMKRKRQIREFMEFMNQDEDDLFEGTPAKVSKSKKVVGNLDDSEFQPWTPLPAQSRNDETSKHDWMRTPASLTPKMPIRATPIARDRKYADKIIYRRLKGAKKKNNEDSGMPEPSLHSVAEESIDYKTIEHAFNDLENDDIPDKSAEAHYFSESDDDL